MTSSTLEQSPSRQERPLLHEGSVLGGRFVVDQLFEQRINSVLYVGHDLHGDKVVFKAAHTVEAEGLIQHELEVAQEFKDVETIITPELVEDENGRPVLVTPFQEGGDLSGVLESTKLVTTKPEAAKVDHDHLRDIIDDVQADVEFLEGIDASCDATSPIIEGLAEALTTKEELPLKIANESDSITAETVLDDVQEAAERIYGVEIDSEGYIANKVALKLLSKADTLDEEKVQQVAVLPSADEVTAKLEVVSTIVETVEEVHKKGYVYIDLKESNILLNKRGEIRLIDMASASEIGADVEVNKYYGSPDNIPAELFRATNNVNEDRGCVIPQERDEDDVDVLKYDESMDVYGLGRIAFKAITGREAYDLSLAEVDAVAVKDVLEGFSGNMVELDAQVDNGVISSQLGDVVMLSLNSTPEKRPTVAELREAIAA